MTIAFSLSGIFIAGGFGNDSTTPPGFYNPLTNEYCNIPQMNQPRFGSTTTGLKVCGGYDLIDYNAQYKCEMFDPATGTWGPYCGSWELLFPGRALHVAWMSSIGLLLIGGRGQSW